jgi:diaminopimelate epimerase
VTKRAQSPVTIDMTGGSLTVSWAPGEPIRMRGSATQVYEGDLDLDALK